MDEIAGAEKAVGALGCDEGRVGEAKEEAEEGEDKAFEASTRVRIRAVVGVGVSVQVSAPL